MWNCFGVAKMQAANLKAEDGRQGGCGPAENLDSDRIGYNQAKGRKR